MLPRATEVLDALVERLERISPALGYATALTGVYRGRSALSLPATTPLPLLLVRSESVVETGGSRAVRRYERALTLEAVLAAEADPEPAADALIEDVFRALGLKEARPLAGLATALTPGPIAFVYPEPESGVLLLRFALTVTYLQHYDEDS